MGTPMRVLHIAPTGNWAGTEEMVCRLANDTAAQHDVTVMMEPGENASIEQIRSRFQPNVRVIIADTDATPAERMRVVLDEGGVPDIVHAHLRPGLAHAWHLRNLAPVIGHLHVRFFSAQFWWVDAVVCVSPWQARDIPAWFQGEVFLVPNSLAPFEPAGFSEAAAFRDRIGASQTSVVYGSIGRLAAEKGFDLLIKAFRSGFGDDDRLVIVGNGPAADQLHALADGDQRIHFAGYVPSARRLLTAFDVYVSASRLDSFGLSILEAMSVGLPIVSTRARGPADLLHGQPAQLVPVEDIPALRSAMASAITPQKTLRYDLDRYQHDRCAADMHDVYTCLLDPTAPVPACRVSGRTTSSHQR